MGGVLRQGSDFRGGLGRRDRYEGGVPGDQLNRRRGRVRGPNRRGWGTGQGGGVSRGGARPPIGASWERSSRCGAWGTIPRRGDEGGTGG